MEGLNMEKLIHEIQEIIVGIEGLKEVKKEEKYKSIHAEINCSGKETGKKYKVIVDIDEDENITIGGDLPTIEVVKQAVKEFYERN